MRLTKWFPASVKPVRKGAYETSAVSGCETYQHWNGVFWGMYAPSPERASESAYSESVSSEQNVEWRGLASNY